MTTTGRQSLCRGSDAVTHGVRVRVEPSFMPDESSPDEGKWLFGYHIVMTNESPRPIRLLTRHWQIVDGDGDAHDVDGEGVVGHQPHLAPGESFEYSSFCPLHTHWGTMEGWYEFVRDDGEVIRVRVARFILVASA